MSIRGSKFCGLVVLLVLINLSCPNFAKTNQFGVSNNFIDETCNKFEVEFRELCIGVVNADPHEDLKSSYKGLLAIFMHRCITNSTNDYMYLLEQLKRSDLDNRTQSVFDGCKDEYKEAIHILKSSLNALLKNESSGRVLASDMNKVIRKFDGCDQSFDGFVQEPPSWSARYAALSTLLELLIGAANLNNCNKIHPCGAT